MHPPRSIADEEIIRQCIQGSIKYQELLYKRFYGYAMGIGMRYSFTRDDALEVVNDAFIKVFNGINSYNTDKPFKAWLRTIVVNTAIDRRRKDMKHQQTSDLEDAVMVSSHSYTVEKLNADDILKMMYQLPDIQRTIFNLYEIDGYNHDEIADMLSIPSSSSRVYLSRAKERLRKVLTTTAHNHG